MKVVPENKAVGLQHSQHFRRHLPAERRIEDGRENRGLNHDVHGFIREVECGGTAARDRDAGWAEPFGFDDSVRNEVDADEPLRAGTPLDEVSKPVGSAAADLKDVAIRQSVDASRRRVRARAARAPASGRRVRMRTTSIGRPAPSVERRQRGSDRAPVRCVW